MRPNAGRMAMCRAARARGGSIEGMMNKLIVSGIVAAAIGLFPIPADAQIYELVKVCKRKWQTAVACIVIEKGVEKVVEKSAEEWLSYYRKGNDKPALTPPPML